MQIEPKASLVGLGNWKTAIIFIVSIVIFCWSLLLVVYEKVFFFDEWIQAKVSVIATDIMQSFFKLFTILGDKAGVIPILIISLALIWWKTKDYRGMAVLTFGIIAVNELNKLLKDWTGRERPMTGPGAESLSFPSGHAMVGLFFYGLLTYLLVQYLKGKVKTSIIVAISSIFIFLLGFSRLVLNYHYPSDVLAGYAAGGLCLLVFINLYNWLILKSKRTF